jgi:hypothetical protein
MLAGATAVEDDDDDAGDDSGDVFEILGHSSSLSIIFDFLKMNLNSI